MSFKDALQQFLTEHSAVEKRRWALRIVTECMIQPLTPSTGVSRPYDDRGLKLHAWFQSGEVTPCSGDAVTRLLGLRFGADPQEVFGAISELCPELLPDDASVDWMRPSPFRQI